LRQEAELGSVAAIIGLEVAAVAMVGVAGVGRSGSTALRMLREEEEEEPEEPAVVIPLLEEPGLGFMEEPEGQRFHG
jgi:NCAIR mutase (PurE)-related protein